MRTKYDVVAVLVVTFFVGILTCVIGHTAEPATEAMPDFNRLANAIYKAEGGTDTKHPYGILAKYKHTTPRQACLNTCRNQWYRHTAHRCGKKYFTCLRDRYAPIGADNDPKGLNKNWLKNVTRFYYA